MRRKQPADISSRYANRQANSTLSVFTDVPNPLRLSKPDRRRTGATADWAEADLNRRHTDSQSKP